MMKTPCLSIAGNRVFFCGDCREKSEKSSAWRPLVSGETVCYNRNDYEVQEVNRMTIKFDVKMTKKAMTDFMLYTSYTSLSGIAGVVFGGVVLVLGISQLMNGVYSSGAMLLLFAGFFLIGNPLQMKARAAQQVTASPMFQKPITYELTEEGVRITQEEASVLNEWKDFRKAVSTGQSIILYITKVRAVVLPKEALGEQFPAAVQMISTHMPAKKVNIRHVSA